MANTVLPVTNNPVQNIQNSQPTSQMSNPTTSISPITIPIQIQPQVAGNTTEQTTNNIQNLQTQNQNSNNIQQPQYNVPRVEQAQNPVNTNTVDFNQIYKGYQSQYGVNPNNGIKQSSIGTTIVTPTNVNLNTVEGQYQSAYADTVNSLISAMLNERIKGFEYDPLQDNSLKVASEYAANTTLQSLAGSGVLNSSATAERVARIVSELIPQYEEKAHNRWIEYLGQLSDMAQVVMNYDNQQFNIWKDAKDREFQDKQFQYQKEQDRLENAWKRVDELGYVDNKASTILGVAVGTLSKDAREAKEEREFALKKMREQAEIEFANQQALYKIKAELDLANDKALYQYKANVDLDTTQKTYELQKQGKIATTKTNSNLTTYDGIIQNRFAEYDQFTRQYTVPDTETYNELRSYLMNLYASGQISATELSMLSAKYSKISSVSETTNNDNTKEMNVSTTLKNVENYIKNGNANKLRQLIGG